MIDASQIREHMHVHSSDGEHIGTVDRVEGNQIKLTKQDRNAKGRHHTVPLDWVQSVQGDQVRLGKSADEARKQWQVGAKQS